MRHETYAPKIGFLFRGKGPFRRLNVGVVGQSNSQCRSDESLVPALSFKIPSMDRVSHITLPPLFTSGLELAFVIVADTGLQLPEGRHWPPN